MDEIARHPAPFKVFIGGRQIGKTFNVLLYHLDNDIPFVLMRRTIEELDTLTHPKFNPFLKINLNTDYNIQVFKEGKFYSAYDVDQEGIKTDKLRCMIVALPQLAKRGFDGSTFTSIIFDEFIPEIGVRVLRSEDENLLNAYTTIDGNREIEGEAPCALWLLANSNRIDSPILEAFNLTDTVLKMKARGLEVAEYGKAIIIRPKSRKIMEQRKQTALMQHISHDSEFYQMSIENEFAYDQSPLIKNINIKYYRPLFSYGNLYAWESEKYIYICKAHHKTERYNNSNFDREQLRQNYAWIVRAYAAGLVFFSDLHLLSIFKWLFDIDF